jgi:hypothetical protein
MSDPGTPLSEEQLAEFVSAGTKALTLIAKRLGPDLAKRWAQNGAEMQRAFLAALLRPTETAPAVLRPSMEATSAFPDRLILSVDYRQTLEQMIAAGQFGWANSAITAKHFAAQGDGTAEFEARLFLFDRGSSSEGAVEAMHGADPTTPWIPAKIEHLLAFAALYPEEQRKYPIIALGSVASADGPRQVPYLYSDEARRHLHLSWWALDWPDDARFLAVRRLPSATSSAIRA